mmetsp:Transcript_86522/g.264757  ORF Transcript_86522/g.264757 Transcript_86522/m.264757 type:complete len:107 (-) Transcript_86522:111-431(-)
MGANCNRPECCSGDGKEGPFDVTQVRSEVLRAQSLSPTWQKNFQTLPGGFAPLTNEDMAKIRSGNVAGLADGQLARADGQLARARSRLAEEESAFCAGCRKNCPLM